MPGTRTATRGAERSAELTPKARRCRKKFLAYFPDGFRDEVFVETERLYKWNAHRMWVAELDRTRYAALLAQESYGEIASTALRVEARTNLLFSFEKMALRDALKTPAGSRDFAHGLFHWLYGTGSEPRRFADWCDVVRNLPRRQTRVVTWPIVTVFGFLSRPRKHIILKPNVTRAAAAAYGFDLDYRASPSWETYSSLLALAAQIRDDQRDLGPRDLIDIQSFIWTQGSPEYQ